MLETFIAVLIGTAIGLPIGTGLAALAIFAWENRRKRP